MNELACPLFVPPSAHTGAGGGACGWAGMPGAAARSFRPGLSISLFPKQRAVPLWHLKLEKQRKGGEASTALPKPHRLPKRNLLGLWHPSMSGHKLPLSSTWASLAAVFGEPKGWLPLQLHPPLFLLLSCIAHLLLYIPVSLLT